MKFWIVYIFASISLLTMIITPTFSATISNGGMTVIDEETKPGKVEICPATFGSKRYDEPSWVKHVMAPIQNVTSLFQVPVALFRGPERAFEQATSKSRDEGNPCFNYRYRKGQNFQTKFSYEDLNFGDSVTVGKLEVSVTISSDTE